MREIHGLNVLSCNNNITKIYERIYQGYHSLCTSFKNLLQKKVKEVFAELKEDSALLKGKVKEVLKEC